jgi:filamentous hemagglutinin
VGQTASGVDQINIAAPNASGLSHNKFTDYNVNEQGQIINNFSGKVASEVAGGSGSTAVTETQIGGLVTVNSNLASSGSARVILNEVTSSNVSQILGYTEIAGSKADLIIANPNGIVCNGCGFINTSHLTFVAGRSDFDNNGNLGFNLTNPTLTNSGNGLGDGNNDYITYFFRVKGFVLF